MVTSRQNARVRELRAALRGRPPAGLVAVEGWVMVTEALRAARDGFDVPFETVFAREDAADRARAEAGEAPMVVLSHAAFDSAAGTEQSQGIAALVRRPSSAYTPRIGDLLVVAAGLQDPGNLGTLIRSAEAFGAAAVVLAEHSVDPWNGKALRASAGATFRMSLPAWSPALLAALREQQIRLLAAVPTGGTIASAADLRSGCALLLGNEGSGLSTAMLALADGRITLSMAGPTESLNAAVAGSLLLYEAARQRSEQG